MRHRWSRALAALTCAGGLAVGAQSAEAAIYYGFQNGAIGRVDVDGSNKTDALVSTDYGVIGVTTDDTYLYWANRASGQIGRARLDGSEQNDTFIAPGGVPEGIAVDEDHLYWTDTATDSVLRADVHTGEVDDEFSIQAGGNPEDVALDDSYVYWTQSPRIGRADLDGTNVDLTFSTAAAQRGLAIDGGRIFFAGGTRIGVADLDGTVTNADFLTGLRTGGMLTVGGGTLYFPQDLFPPADAIYSADAADGSGAAPFVTLGPTSVWGIEYGPLLGRLDVGAAPTFPSTLAGAVGPDRTVTFTNAGERDVTVSDLRVVGADSGDFEIAAENCRDAQVAVAGSCEVTLRFAPGAAGAGGAKSATLHLVSDVNDGPAPDVALAATALAPATATLGPAPAFPDQAVGTVGPARTVTVDNDGDVDLDLSDISLTGASPGDFELDGGTCDDGPVAPGGSCEVELRFAPTSAGAKVAALRLVSNAPSSPDTLALGATALTPAALSFGDDPAFGQLTVGDPPVERTVVIHNDGEASLTVGAVALAGTDAADFQITGEDCTAAPIAGGGSCEVTIRFAPGTAGTKSAELRVLSDAATSPDALPLTAVALAPPPDPPRGGDEEPPRGGNEGLPRADSPRVEPPRADPPRSEPPANGMPVAVATASLRSAKGERVQRYLLDAGRSRDRDGRIVAYRWQLDGRTIGTSARQVVSLPARRRPYVVTLTVTDDRGATASRRLTVRVRMPRPTTATIRATVRFDVASSSLRPAGARAIRRLRAVADGSVRVEIAGHSDSRGTADVNRRLSERRARTVAAALLRGLRSRPGRVDVVGRGASDPLRPNTTAAGRAANRSVRIAIVVRR